jgi:hypothetical protein
MGEGRNLRTRDFHDAVRAPWLRVVLFDDDVCGEVRLGVAQHDRELLGGGVQSVVDDGIVEIDCPILASDVAALNGCARAEIHADAVPAALAFSRTRLDQHALLSFVVAANDVRTVAGEGSRNTSATLEETRRADFPPFLAPIDDLPGGTAERLDARFQVPAAATRSHVTLGSFVQIQTISAFEAACCHSHDTERREG